MSYKNYLAIENEELGMNNIGNKTPKIRFKGYTEDWEQRKLGEVCENTYGGGTPSTAISEYWDGDIPWIQSQDIIENQLFGVNPRKYISKEAVTKSATKLIPENSITIVTRVGVGKLAFMPFSYCTSQDFLSLGGIKIDEKFAIYSIYKMLQKEKQNVQGTSIKGITTDETLSKIIEIPSDETEQSKIGSYFQSLDNLITLHQRKCESLKKVKKSMLQKMFPKNGASVPEIRFAGFTGDWERRKLGEVAEFSKGNGYSKGDLCPVGTPIILYGRLYTKYETVIKEVDTFVMPKEGSVYSKGGEVIVPASGETAEDIARAATVENAGILLGGDLNVVTPNKDINSAFLALSISNGEPQKELAKKAQGKSVVHIHNKEIKGLDIGFPEREEQEKISTYFQSLDNLITLHQRKVEKLKEIKKSMLQKMFV